MRLSFVSILFSVGVFLLFFTQSCERCKRDDAFEEALLNYRESGVDSLRIFILNAGTPSTQLSLSYYLPQKKKAFNNVYREAASSYLDRLAINMVIRNNRGFIPLYSSNRILVIDLESFLSIAYIKDTVEEPNIVHFIDDNKAYVGHFCNPKITIIQPKRFVVLGEIDIRKEINFEGIYDSGSNMVSYKDLVFVGVCIRNRPGKILAVDAKKNTIVSVIETQRNPIALQLDENNKLWVFHTTDLLPSKTEPSLARIDPETQKVELKIPLPGQKRIELFGMAINAKRNTLYWIEKRGVWKMPITADKAPSEPFIALDQARLLSIALDPENEDVYVTDAIDTTNNKQKGMLYRYSKEGELIDHQKVGVYPINLVFDSSRSLNIR